MLGPLEEAHAPRITETVFLEPDAQLVGTQAVNPTVVAATEHRKIAVL
jgi:hypothetical protein